MTVCAGTSQKNPTASAVGVRQLSLNIYVCFRFSLYFVYSFFCFLSFKWSALWDSNPHAKGNRSLVCRVYQFRQGRIFKSGFRPDKKLKHILWLSFDFKSDTADFLINFDGRFSAKITDVSQLFPIFAC